MDSLMDPDVVWGFQDESAQRISSRTARLWSLSKPIRRTNTDRINAKIFGFYAVRGNSMAFFPEHSMTADMCDFLDAVRRANGSRKVVLILDNGPVHHLKVCRSMRRNWISISCICLRTVPSSTPSSWSGNR